MIALATLRQINLTPALIIILGSLLLSSCKESPKSVQVSEQPVSIAPLQETKIKPREGRFSLRSRIAYSDIQSLIESEIPPSHVVQDTRQLCKRIIGIKVCGTANWALNVERYGPPEVSGQQQRINVKVPIAFDGIVGMEGKVAKALGLTNLDVKGSVVADINLGLKVDENWCPSVSVLVTYLWTEKPTIVWRNKMDFSVEKIMTEALDKQLMQLEERVNESINCDLFRQQIEAQWKSYTFALDLPGLEGSHSPENVHLNFTPTGFAFSGLHTQQDKLGLAFALDGMILVDKDPLPVSAQPLPPLIHIEYQQSGTDFDILLRATYAQLDNLLEPQLQGKTYTSNSLAGEAFITVENVSLAGNSQGVTVSLGFNAQLPGHSDDIRGTVFLIATPEIDADNEQLTLHNIRLTKVIDSALWNLLSSIFEGQIIAAIERQAVIDYAPRLRELEQKIIEQFQDTYRTGGVAVTTRQLSISLIDIAPEAASLAVIARVSADMDIDIPVSLIQKTIQ